MNIDINDKINAETKTKSRKILFTVSLVFFVVFLLLFHAAAFIIALQIDHTQQNAIILASVPVLGPAFLLFQCILAGFLYEWLILAFLFAPCLITFFSFFYNIKKEDKVNNSVTITDNNVVHTEFENDTDKYEYTDAEQEDKNNASDETDDTETAGDSPSIDDLINKYSQKQ